MTVLWGEHYRDLCMGGGSYAEIDASGIQVTAADNMIIRGFKFRNPGTAITIDPVFRPRREPS